MIAMFVKMIGMELFSRTPYTTNKVAPIVFTMRRVLISFITKDTNMVNEAM